MEFLNQNSMNDARTNRLLKRLHDLQINVLNLKSELRSETVLLGQEIQDVLKQSESALSVLCTPSLQVQHPVHSVATVPRTCSSRMDTQRRQQQSAHLFRQRLTEVEQQCQVEMDLVRQSIAPLSQIRSQMEQLQGCGRRPGAVGSDYDDAFETAYERELGRPGSRQTDLSRMATAEMDMHALDERQGYADRSGMKQFGSSVEQNLSWALHN